MSRAPGVAYSSCPTRFVAHPAIRMEVRQRRTNVLRAATAPPCPAEPAEFEGFRSTIELGPHGKMILPARPWGFKVIQLSVNGQVQRFEPGANVARLLEALELSGKRVAVEKNGEIVPRSRYAQTRLADGDALEIVVAVGGG